jgi:hypothetical protein
MSKAEVINAKCDEAGCSKEAREEHRLAFWGRWDVHPPSEFLVWHVAQNPDLLIRPNVITAWNSDRERQEFYKSRGEAPDAVEPIEEERNLL